MKQLLQIAIGVEIQKWLFCSFLFQEHNNRLEVTGLTSCLTSSYCSYGLLLLQERVSTSCISQRGRSQPEKKSKRQRIRKEHNQRSTQHWKKIQSVIRPVCKPLSGINMGIKDPTRLVSHQIISASYPYQAW
jgi:hypothetical protein